MTFFEKYPLKYLISFALILDVILPKNNTQIAIAYLIGLMILDFITGIMASYVEAENKQELEKYKTTNKFLNSLLYFVNTGIVYKIRNLLFKLSQVITSKKLKLSGVKAILYFSTIIVTYIFEQIFFIKSFNLSFSDLKFSLTLSMILFWSAVEWYSIFFENFKKIGIDFKLIIRNMIKNILNIKSEFDKLK